MEESPAILLLISNLNSMADRYSSMPTLGEAVVSQPHRNYSISTGTSSFL